MKILIYFLSFVYVFFLIAPSPFDYKLQSNRGSSQYKFSILSKIVRYMRVSIIIRPTCKTLIWQWCHLVHSLIYIYIIDL